MLVSGFLPVVAGCNFGPPAGSIQKTSRSGGRRLTIKMQGNSMSAGVSGRWVAVVLLLAFSLGGCASKEETFGPSETYEKVATKTEMPRCPTGYVLQCEHRATGRIRFGRIGTQDPDSCACEEYMGMPTQSPVPGIQ